MTDSSDPLDSLRSESKAALDRAETHRYVERARNNEFVKAVDTFSDRKIRKRIDEVFSREMLGSVLVGATVARATEVTVAVAFGTLSPLRILTWMGIFALSVGLFVWWEHVAEKASDAADKATDAADEATDKATEAAEKATDKASDAADKASDAASDSDAAETAADVAETAAEAAEKATDEAAEPSGKSDSTSTASADSASGER